MSQLVKKHSPEACWKYTEIRCQDSLDGLVSFWMENCSTKGATLPEPLPLHVLFVLPIAVLFLGNEHAVFRGAQSKDERAADPMGKYLKASNGREDGARRVGADGSMKHKAGARRDHATTLRLLFQIMAAGDSLQTRQTPRTNMVGRGGSIVVAEGIVVDAATVGATDPNALPRFLSSATNLVWTQRVIQVGSSKNLPEVLGAAGAKSRLVHIKTLLAVLQKRIVADSREEFGGLSPTPFTLQLMSPSGQKMRYIHGTNDISHAFEVSISSAFFSLDVYGCQPCFSNFGIRPMNICVVFVSVLACSFRNNHVRSMRMFCI